MARVYQSSRKPNKRRISSEQKLFFSVLISAVPVVMLLIFVLNDPDISLFTKSLVSGFCLIWMLAVAASTREMFVYHIRTLSNLVEAIRTEDYSMRSSRVRDPGELAELYQQVNALTDQLKHVRQEELELNKLFERVVNQINVAIVACDADDKIRLVNRLASKLLDAQVDALIGRSIHDTELAPLVVGDSSQLIDHEFPGAKGRWQINIQRYRHQGKPGKLIFVTDLKQVLNEEEISAWQRLIRVIAHEVNNSLTPISSICQTLESQMSKAPEERCDEDIRQGLEVIEERARGLKNFISVYARLAKMPDPQKIHFPVQDLLHKLLKIFADQALEVCSSDASLKLFGDPVLIEQALINLIKNALEASGDDSEAIQLGCDRHDGVVEFSVADRGAGILNPTNLFVPFYTTKEKGAGIGLALCRQIAAKHGGQVLVENRDDGPGAIARLQIPAGLS